MIHSCTLTNASQVHLSILGSSSALSPCQVVVLTHAYGDRSGVRWMTNGLKVYYIPRLPFYCQSTFPTIYGTLPIVRVILIRERISVIHGHQVRGAVSIRNIFYLRICWQAPCAECKSSQME